MSKIFFLVASVIFLSACTKVPQTSNNLDINSPPTNNPVTNISPTRKISTTPRPTANINSDYVGLNTKDGQIVIKLYSDSAPNTVKNFKSKVNSGFYNGLTFHRVIQDFMAQGGDPTGTGTGGGKINSELNSRPFKRGSVGLARTAETNKVSNDSQFFICFNDTGCSHLTGDYVNFGEVVSGFQYLDQIIQGDKILSISFDTK